MNTTTTQMADVMIHVDESTSHADREALRSELLARDGVMAADYHDDKPHLILVLYDPDEVSSKQLLEVPAARGLHAQLVGL
ncbi:MAG TPA: hypothetical protein VIT02_14065 [Burkholderiaceae bacterium]